jgi:hypothetical protein
MTKCYNYMRKVLTADNLPQHNCPKHCHGSFKGMEATAALEMVKGLFEDEPVACFVTQMVIDDMTMQVFGHY